MKKEGILTFGRPLALFALMSLAAAQLFAGGKSEAVPNKAEPEHQPVTILVAAAASLQYSYQELIPLFQEQYPWITVDGTYDSSGKLQTQIEQGLEADVFMSAAMTQMNNLVKGGLVAADSVKPLLENKIVLIKPAGTVTPVTGFENCAQAKIIALGDPASVPAGQYAKEAFTSLGNWDAVSARASFGTNVTEVLNWVGEGSAEVGVVYATDAATSKKVEIIAEAPAGSLSAKVLYPIGIVNASAKKDAAKLFMDFLASPDGLAIFLKYGFAGNK
ncbi:molybdate ABC transporter substrate-binding protein [Leadbettera azotonutricia]|uniref:Molybdate ABC transporter, periplasmic molybdate-binding protein n=1 Tax=Leadbettera azotonutricia (strain ATCC BAA-888 / DSM 13862 / ZAS-9) TaxID=545695 RepID=F5Y991_LEAAZ|nr:molybdate ABC transporter substrate-binding protein [Leadbettera azotonutricia]AEF80307.1 molybdate ABC transporter, periplasmic molybdate-binding protein [Leadbettera azotonutricia ZAS-9]